MAECDFKLAAELTAPCDELSHSGLKNTAVIINYDDIDWDNVEHSSTNPNIVTKFQLKEGTTEDPITGFKCYVPGKTPFTGTNKALATGTYRNKFTKQIKLVVLNNGADVCHKIIDQLANGRFVVIVENDFQGDATAKDNVFEFYGLELGLSATEMADDKYSEDTDGGWSVTLEETNAPTSGLFYLKDGSFAGTRASVEALY